MVTNKVLLPGVYCVATVQVVGFEEKAHNMLLWQLSVYHQSPITTASIWLLVRNKLAVFDLSTSVSLSLCSCVLIA